MRFADTAADPRLSAVAARLRAPLHVAVHGRRGVGRSTVAAALSGAGVAVTDRADVGVLVVAEAVKPEDRTCLAAWRAAGVAALTVLNKADLLGFPAPAAAAARRTADCRAATGTPTVPMIAVLAAASPDPDEVAALQALAAEPADLGSPDGFVGGAHRVPAPVRARLAGTLDRYGVAQAVLALQRGAEPATLPALLRELSLLDGVLAGLDAVAAPLRYRRVRAAVDELRCLATTSDDERLDAFLAGDDAVLAVMSAAVDVVQAAGLTVDASDDPADHLRRARTWRRYGSGPVAGLHRACAADICRGSLRLYERTR
jgi:hypothetical protein